MRWRRFMYWCDDYLYPLVGLTLFVAALSIALFNDHRIDKLESEMETLQMECYDTVMGTDRVNYAMEILHSDLKYLKDLVDPWWTQ